MSISSDRSFVQLLDNRNDRLAQSLNKERVIEACKMQRFWNG